MAEVSTGLRPPTSWKERIGLAFGRRCSSGLPERLAFHTDAVDMFHALGGPPGLVEPLEAIGAAARDAAWGTWGG